MRKQTKPKKSNTLLLFFIAMLGLAMGAIGYIFGLVIRIIIVILAGWIVFKIGELIAPDLITTLSSYLK